MSERKDELDSELDRLVADERRVRHPAPPGLAAEVLAGVRTGTRTRSDTRDPSTKLEAAARASNVKLGAALVVGIVLGAAGMKVLSGAPSSSPPVIGAAPVTASAPPPSTTSVPEPSATTSGQASAAPPTLPASVAPLARPRPHASSSGVDAGDAPRPDPLARERVLLDVARAGVARRDGAAALDAIRNYDAEFAQGVLVEERDAVEIRALVLAGRVADAKARFVAFQARYPGSVLASGLSRSLDASGRE